ncbi:MAG: hypothetical protein ACD_51C00355G0003 [uncultured bacterium]|nr:MAG: hypothetical protein ACD_51C00355G0003 [uncultured bacterium]
MSNKPLYSTFKNEFIFKAIIISFCVLIIAFLAFKPTDDPDFGWHIKTGEQIIERAEVPRTDWFTHSSPDFKWVDHEWTTNVLMFGLYRLGGPFLLSVISCALILYIFVFLAPKTLEKKFPIEQRFIFGTIGIAAVTFFVGVRPQILALIGIALVFIIVNRLKQNPGTKLIYFLPVIMIAWANMHASFVAAFVILAIFLIFESAKRNTIENLGENQFAENRNTLTFPSIKKLFVLTIASAAATLINPYTYRIYEEIYRTATDSYGTREINEWLSPDFSDMFGIAFAVYLSLYLIVLFFKKARMDLSNFVLFIIFLLAALISRRNIPLFVLITLPYFFEGSSAFYKNFLKPILKNKFILITLAIVTTFSIFQYGNFYETISKSFYQKKVFEGEDYPTKALDYLRKNPIGGNMLNEYNWGGYLILEYPEKKVFADGRCAHWKNDDRHLLKIFLDTVDYRQNAESILDEYEISFVLLQKERPLAEALKKNKNWKVAYSDENTVVIERSK